ncbi:MAG TPA: SUMF1/EgtB/PvdO family nonheme iron enzyme [Ktedonobacterales bacterium]|jgi:formylglycine-generating enzyme required for sulfatase activity
MPAPRIYLCYDDSDEAFGRALALDLRAAGAGTWDDATGPLNDPDQSARRAFLVVLSPAALASPAIQRRIADAVELRRLGAVQTILPIIAAPCDLPPALAAFPAIARADDPAAARARVLAALDLTPPIAPEAALVPASAIPSAAPGTAAEPIALPPKLAALGYTGWRVEGNDLILPPLCVVPGGAFLMGDASGAGDPAEAPVHRVELATYGIATFPVTVAEYACFAGAGHRLPPDMGRVTWSQQFSRLEHPVVNISWHDAIAYAAWLAARTGGRWRLPTEAEWECAARWDAAAGVAREYPWGDAFDPERCNTRESALGASTPINTYPNGTSPHGAHDMAGNVREWTSSRYAAYPYAAGDGREQPTAPGDRVQRGGSWFNFAGDARCAFRDWHAPDEVNPVVGFRLVLDPPASARA